MNAHTRRCDRNQLVCVEILVMSNMVVRVGAVSVVAIEVVIYEMNGSNPTAFTLPVNVCGSEVLTSRVMRTQLRMQSTTKFDM